LVRITPSRHRLVEGDGHVHGLLAGHGVDDEQGVVGCEDVADLAELVHEGGVDLEAPRGVDDHHAAPEPGGLLPGGGGDVDRLPPRAVGGAEHGDVEPPSQHPQLLDGGRALEVGGHEEHAEPLALEVAGELPGRGGLAGPLEAGEHHDRGGPGAHGELPADPAEGGDQLLVDDLDDLLGRAEAGTHSAPEARSLTGRRGPSPP